jgi:hypothetical protein
VPGTYEVTAILPENLTWVACQPTSTLDVAANQHIVHNFGVNPPAGPSATGSAFGNGFLSTLAPNPAPAGQPVRLEVTASKAQPLTLQVFEATGRLRGQVQRQVPAGTSSQPLGLPLGQGVYFVKIIAEGGQAQTLLLTVF